jgi:pyruvate dehydrogenase E2 component (dihydrolipoamide acetyltransferase)
MPVEITVPRQGWSMEEGIFVEWRKNDGDRIQPGDPLYLLESEKSTEEIEALEAGILCIPPDAPKAGDKVVVGQVLAFLLSQGEAAPMSCNKSAASRQQGADAAGRKPVPAVGPAAGPAARRIARSAGIEPADVAGSGPSGRISEDDIQRHSQPARSAALHSASKTISPRARRVARELGVDWNQLEGTGRTGRIRERDIRAAVGDRDDGRLIPHTQIRRTIATRMVAGVTQAAPVTITTRADATNLVNLRNQFKAMASKDEAVPGYTDMILKLTAAALRRHELLLAQWRDEGLFVPAAVDIAFAVDTDSGLLAPVIRGADRLSLRAIAAQTRVLTTQARAGRLAGDQMRNATFTITNLGGFGVDAFTPIIHLPQCAVLGVGRIVREAVVVQEQIVPRDLATLSLTFDHRIVDGAPAARFLQTLRGGVEQPAPWLIP